MAKTTLLEAHCKCFDFKLYIFLLYISPITIIPFTLIKSTIGDVLISMSGSQRKWWLWIFRFSIRNGKCLYFSALWYSYMFSWQMLIGNWLVREWSTRIYIMPKVHITPVCYMYVTSIISTSYHVPRTSQVVSQAKQFTVTRLQLEVQLDVVSRP